jgi:GNAT superfamily N-acetyltransferase
MTAFAIRRLTPADACDIARVHRASFDDRLPWLSGIHTPDEDLAYFRDTVCATCALWGAFEGQTLVGFIAFRDGWIDHLFVAPDKQMMGLGTRLLDQAKAAQSRLRLWTFQRNDGARNFYDRSGFIQIDITDGSGNEEREPDVLYEWSGTTRF